MYNASDDVWKSASNHRQLPSDCWFVCLVTGCWSISDWSANKPWVVVEQKKIGNWLLTSHPTPNDYWKPFGGLIGHKAVFNVTSKVLLLTNLKKKCLFFYLCSHDTCQTTWQPLVSNHLENFSNLLQSPATIKTSLVAKMCQEVAIWYILLLKKYIF